jgi:hypothetical protein
MTDQIDAISCPKAWTPWPTWGSRMRLPRCSVWCWVGSTSASTGSPRERWRAEGHRVVGRARNLILTVVAHQWDGRGEMPSGGNRPRRDGEEACRKQSLEQSGSMLLPELARCRYTRLLMLCAINKHAAQSSRPSGFRRAKPRKVRAQAPELWRNPAF